MVHIVEAGDIVDHYCLMFNRGVVHIVVAVILLTITVSCLTEERFILLWLVILLPITVSMYNRGLVHIVVADYIVDHYCLMFNTVMVNNITSLNNMDHSSVKPEIVIGNNITTTTI
jgi:hypothetical protein